MCRTKTTGVILLSVLTLCLLVESFVMANGGPFVIKYPNGDPAAKGVLARLDPDLKPARETRLRVIKEDLKVTFGRERPFGRAGKNIDGPPLAHVSAEYTIENPTNEEIEVDTAALEEDKKYLLNYLKSQIAGSTWGRNEALKIRLKDDNQVMQSLEYFEEANDFIKQLP